MPGLGPTVPFPMRKGNPRIQCEVTPYSLPSTKSKEVLEQGTELALGFQKTKFLVHRRPLQQVSGANHLQEGLFMSAKDSFPK